MVCMFGLGGLLLSIVPPGVRARVLAVSARRGVTPALEAVFVVVSWGWAGKRSGGKVPFVGRVSLDDPPPQNLPKIQVCSQIRPRQSPARDPVPREIFQSEIQFLWHHPLWCIHITSGQVSTFSLDQGLNVSNTTCKTVRLVI
jgi:hypothetical protein